MKDPKSFSPFAHAIMLQKYSRTLDDGKKETWEEIAKRVSHAVMRAVNAPKPLVKEIEKLIADRKFMPGGRYLYASGRPFHQTQNCLLMRAEDSREGWADLMHKSSMALMTGAGIGIVYSDVRAEGKPIRKTGGFATGPLALMQMVNEAGRGIMQGGSRRSAIWAGLHWSHADSQKFITLKNWIPEVRALKEKDYNFPATMDGTNISVILDDEFFEAYHDSKHEKHGYAQSVYWATVRQMLKTAEPGFSIDIGKNVKENLRNAPVAADTWVLTSTGYRQVGAIVGHKVTVWTGSQWATTEFKRTKEMAATVRVTMTGGREIVADPTHEFLVERYEGAGERRKLVKTERIPAGLLEEGDVLAVSLPSVKVGNRDRESYVLGYTYGDGSFCKRYENRAEITFCTDESKKCVSAMAGSPLIQSVTERDGRGYTRMYLKDEVFRGRTKEIYPESMDMFNEQCDRVTSTASFIAGLFDSDGSYDKDQNRIRLSSVHRSFLEGARRALETLGIQSGISAAGISTFGNHQGWNLTVNESSVNRFIELIPTVRIKPNPHTPYRSTTIKVVSVTSDVDQDVYCCDVGVPEHSFVAEGVVIANCTEITSSDDSDICNIGSINLSRIESLEEMKRAVELATAFLLAGSVYSDVPYPLVDKIRTKNRRLGLGLMGLHEWLLMHGKTYGPDPDLEEYLKIYATSDVYAKKYAKEWDLSVPVKTRAIAPTGTIGIVAETTTGIEPIFCVAYKRRYLKGQLVQYQYVVDPTAQRLIDSGVNPDIIEDAYTLAENVERRVAFQAWVQQYVDHGISSTINLPSWGSELNNDSKVREFGTMLIKYLPKLRGVTVYPDGARGGQPLSPVKYSTAIKHVGEVFVEGTDICEISKAGSCG